MQPAVPSTVAHCNACHAQLKPSETRCWLCGAAVPTSAEAIATTQRAVAPSPTTARRATSFSLSTLMMFMTLMAVVCGVFSIAPGVGAVMAIVLLPVLAYTVISARREAAMGYTLAPGDRVMLFFGSLALVAATGVAASIAFGASCFAGFYAGAAAGTVLGAQGYDGVVWGLFAGMGLGAIAAAYVGYRVMIAMSRKSVLGHQLPPALSRGHKIIFAVAVLLAVIGAIAACIYVS